MKATDSFLSEVWRNWIGAIRSFKDYWYFFGKWRALVGSIYFLVAVVASVLLLYYGKLDSKWFENAISILPNLLGFSVAAYAILVAFGDEKFKRTIIIHPKKDERSFFLTVNGTFCHFIIVQCLTLIYAVLFKAWGPTGVIYQVFGMVMLLYSLLLTIAVALAVLRMSMTYQTLVRNEYVERCLTPDKEPEETQQGSCERFPQSASSSAPQSSGNNSIVSPY